MATATQNVFQVNLSGIPKLVSYLRKTIWPENNIEVLPLRANHPIIKRVKEVQKLKDAFQQQSSEKVAVVYLSGQPGAGKSQLARQYAEVKYPYSNYVMPETMTVLTLDMADFSDSYRKIATKLRVRQSLINGKDLGKVAEEMKKTLSRRTSWFLIIDNYNSTRCGGFDQGKVSKSSSTQNSFLFLVGMHQE